MTDMTLLGATSPARAACAPVPADCDGTGNATRVSQVPAIPLALLLPEPGILPSDPPPPGSEGFFSPRALLPPPGQGRGALFSTEDDAFLLAKVAEGWTQRRIGAALGRSQASIETRINRLRRRTKAGADQLGPMPRKGGDPWTTAETDRLREMLAEGILQPEIAAALGRTPHSVRSRIQHLRSRNAIPPRAAVPKIDRRVKPKAPKPAPTSSPPVAVRPAPLPRPVLVQPVAAPAPLFSGWPPALDLALVEGLLDPREAREAVLARLARAVGLDREAVLDRFRDLTRAIRHPKRGLDPAGQVRLLAELRAAVPMLEAAE